MSQTIPTLQQPYYSIRTRLDGLDYKLDFRYNTRAERFYLNLYDAEDVLVLAGLKLVTGVLLLAYYHHLPGVPAGEIVVTATGADDSSPKLGELGAGLRCVLTYFPKADVARLKALVPAEF
jgi:hypothetical protein